jgi:geranylgeranyl diphosphate synthase, type I
MPEVAAAALGPQIDAALHAFVEEQVALLTAIDPQLMPVAEQLRASVSGGKRLRAAFCYWGWRASGQADSEAAIRAAAAMELVHAAALVHDDLIDDSPIRRGAPTAHLSLRAAITREGDRDAAARSLALMVGDLLMAWAGQLFTTCGLPAAYLARARPSWATLARELIAGECLEILRTGIDPSVDRSLDVIRYKTAKYTVEHPLHIGGRLAGASQELLCVFSAYGIPVGEAFQLRDDLLSVFGDPCRTGKSNLDDLAGAKPTTLLALALAAATRSERAELNALVGRADLAAEDADRLRAIMERTGARARVEIMITERAASARAALSAAAIPRRPAQALYDLVSAATVRTA